MTYDFSPLSRSFIGFDRMAGLIDNAAKISNSQSYPPYNLAQISEDEYQIEIALAGFTQDDLDIQTHENVLTIRSAKPSATPSDTENVTYVHRGIANRSFERRFQLADHVRVINAELINGLLQIGLRRELPDAMKPRQIEIGSGGSVKSKSSNSNEKLIPSKPCGKSKAA